MPTKYDGIYEYKSSLADMFNDDKRKFYRSADSDKQLAVLKSALEQAFDEGAEGPYDLRQDVLNEILTTLNAKLHQPSPKGKFDIHHPKEWAAHIDKKLTTKIRSFLRLNHNQDCVLAGGAVVRCMVEPSYGWNKSDWDIFGTQEVFQLIIATFPELKWNRKDSYGARYKHVYQLNGLEKGHDGRDIDFIVINPGYPSKKTLTTKYYVDRFDFKFLQCAFSYDSQMQPCLYLADNQVYSDLIHNVINLPESIFRDSKIKSRIKKYIQRGFRDCTGAFDKGLLTKCSYDSSIIQSQQIDINQVF